MSAPTQRQSEILSAVEAAGGNQKEAARVLGISAQVVSRTMAAIRAKADPSLRRSPIDDLPTHIMIPDTQAKAGVPTAHLSWIGRYIVDHFAGRKNIKLIHIGDHADMPALSSYDKGKKSMEGRRYLEDIAAANDAWAILNAPLVRHNEGRLPEKQWWPERHITLGNHEARISRATEDDAQLDGLLSLDALDYARSGWKVHPFLVPVALDGVSYCHYFYAPKTGRPYGDQAHARLKQIGHSFTMGHQQTLDYAVRFVTDGDVTRSQHALIAGASYLHDEKYLGPQGNAHWRGIVVCHGVQHGSYAPMLVPLDYLCRRYERMSLEDFMRKGAGL